MITSFQLRASRSVLGLGVREVGKVIDVSRTTISTWERQPALHILSSKKKDISPLSLFFNKMGLTFPNKNTLSLVTNLPKNFNHLTRFQLRASRATLGLTLNELATLLNMQIQTIAYLESKNNETYINSVPRDFSEKKIKEFFKQHSIIYPDDFSISLLKTPDIKK
jgi:DNA-binding XRE family transcriptional regulator